MFCVKQEKDWIHSGSPCPLVLISSCLIPLSSNRRLNWRGSGICSPLSYVGSMGEEGGGSNRKTWWADETQFAQKMFSLSFQRQMQKITIMQFGPVLSWFVLLKPKKPAMLSLDRVASSQSWNPCRDPILIYANQITPQWQTVSKLIYLRQCANKTL